MYIVTCTTITITISYSLTLCNGLMNVNVYFYVFLTFSIVLQVAFDVQSHPRVKFIDLY